MKPIWFVFLGVGLLAGCSGDDHQDLKAWMAQQTANMHTYVTPLPKLAQAPVVDYDVTDLVDPFQASRLNPEKPGGGGLLKPPPHPREPLEAFPLESLKMVGMMVKANVPVALVRADKTIYQARTGNYLGQNFGVITKITENDLTLKELVEDANGDWVERFSTIQLQEQETKK
jgi:type IV pilus assembly protein PilP